MSQLEIENISLKMLKMQRASIICHNQLLMNNKVYKRKLSETITKQQRLFGSENSVENILDESDGNINLRVKKQLLKSQQSGILAIASQATTYLEY